MKKVTPVTILALFISLLLSGCTQKTPEATTEQKKEFMGGPMPADFQKKQEEMMKKAAEEAKNQQKSAPTQSNNK